MSTFSERLRKYRKKNEMSQADLGLCLNVNRDTIGFWERGVSEPRADHLAMLADAFECSADELVGRKFSSKGHNKIDTLGDEFYKNFHKLRVDRGYLTITDFATSVGASHSGVLKWEWGLGYPQLYWLIAVADTLECSLDELLGRSPYERNETYYS